MKSKIDDICWEEYLEYYLHHNRENTCNHFQISISQHKRLCHKHNFIKDTNLIIQQKRSNSEAMKAIWASEDCIYKRADILAKRKVSMQQVWRDEEYKAKTDKAISESLNKPGVQEARVAKYNWSEVHQKGVETRKKNQTMHVSKPELEMYQFLVEIYGKDNVLTQYKSEEHPWFCDFYIPSIDQYIELNYFWTHGPHPFDINNENDQRLLNLWRSKQGLKPNGRKNNYFIAEDVWTNTDLQKMQWVIDHHLNFMAIYQKGVWLACEHI